MLYNTSEGLFTFGPVFNRTFLLEVHKLQQQIEDVSIICKCSNDVNFILLKYTNYIYDLSKIRFDKKILTHFKDSKIKEKQLIIYIYKCTFNFS